MGAIFFSVWCPLLAIKDIICADVHTQRVRFPACLGDVQGTHGVHQKRGLRLILAVINPHECSTVDEDVRTHRPECTPDGAWIDDLNVSVRQRNDLVAPGLAQEGNEIAAKLTCATDHRYRAHYPCAPQFRR